MSTINQAPKVKPFAAVFAGEGANIVKGIEAFSTIMGSGPDIVSPEFSVTETSYYEKEMGSGLMKVYAAWPGLMPPESLAEIKLKAMAWETENSTCGKRLVNIDPGYVFSGGLVLSTGKFRGHRLPLGQGVWGELTLNYHQGQFMSFPWTYLDYQRPEIQGWLLIMRRAFMASLKQG